jgi:hypothetical protein
LDNCVCFLWRFIWQFSLSKDAAQLLQKRFYSISPPLYPD